MLTLFRFAQSYSLSISYPTSSNCARTQNHTNAASFTRHVSTLQQRALSEQHLCWFSHEKVCIWYIICGTMSLYCACVSHLVWDCSWFSTFAHRQTSSDMSGKLFTGVNCFISPKIPPTEYKNVKQLLIKVYSCYTRITPTQAHAPTERCNSIRDIPFRASKQQKHRRTESRLLRGEDVVTWRDWGVQERTTRLLRIRYHSLHAHRTHTNAHTHILCCTPHAQLTHITSLCVFVGVPFVYDSVRLKKPLPSEPGTFIYARYMEDIVICCTGLSPTERVCYRNPTLLCFLSYVYFLFVFVSFSWRIACMISLNGWMVAVIAI